MLDAFRILSAFLARAEVNSDDVKVVFLTKDATTRYRLEGAIKQDKDIRDLALLATKATDVEFNAFDFKYHGLHILVKEAKRGQ